MQNWPLRKRRRSVSTGAKSKSSLTEDKLAIEAIQRIVWFLLHTILILKTKQLAPGTVQEVVL